MSTQNVTTMYQIVIQAPYGSPSQGFTAGDNWTDEFALQLAAAFAGLTWPEGNTASVQKVVLDNTAYVGDTSVSPAVFD